LNGRRLERLEVLKKELEETYGIRVHICACDIRDRDAVTAMMTTLPKEFQQIDILINNAGLGLGRSPIQDGSVDDWDTMIDTNIKGLLFISHLVIPKMIERKQGQIINIGSIVGKEVYANGNVYCMTKHAVDAITKAMRIDLLPHNIKVTSINPGNVETEFSIVRFKGDKEKVQKTYENYEPLKADDIAEAILFAATRPPHVTINDLTIMPTAQASTAYFHKTR
jgi:3-hydroxy acid dehydrogenase/malonic semialdehyde reductase